MTYGHKNSTTAAGIADILNAEILILSLLNVTTDSVNSTNYTNKTLNIGVVSEDNDKDFIEVCRILWLSGIGASVCGLIAQLCIFYSYPSSRKHDEKLLSLLTGTRILNTVCEHLITYLQINNVIHKDILFTVYFQTDVIMVGWMYVFSKNLYDKIVLVFTYSRFSLIQIFIILFLISLPVGIVGIICLKVTAESSSGHFLAFYHTYDAIKFLVLIINAFIFGRILYIAYKKGTRCNRNVGRYVKVTLISFILVCITSLQVFVTDLCSLLFGYDLVTYPFCVVNSYQVVIITVMFIILAKHKQVKSIHESSYTSNTASVRIRLESTGE